MTRRDFTKLSISSFLLGGGGIIMSNATPRRTLLAAKRIANLRRNAWRNPYAADGLVAMWDGEFPGGVGGKTVQTASEWVDIIGGSVYGRGTNIIYNPTNKCFDTNKIGSSSAARFTFDEMSMADGMTVEIVCAGTFSTSTYRSFFTTQGNSIINVGLSDIQTRPVGSSRAKSGIELNTPFYYANTVTSGGNNNKLYYNGEYQTAGGMPGATQVSYVSAPNQGANNVSGKIYAVRVYSRVLTDAEIAARYATDKTRFNLP